MRELRAESRHGFTYWVRALGAGALMVAALFAVDEGINGGNGGSLFSSMNKILFCITWIIVPLATADCISREKRQGTLVLLFLTPLQPGDIVIAKAIANGLRLLSLLLAAIPVMAIPVLMGGVSMEDIIAGTLIMVSSFASAIGAGLLASTLTRRRIFAQVMALLISVVLLPLFVVVYGNSSWFGCFFLFFVSLILLLVCYCLAVKRLRSTWQENPPSAFSIWFEETFCTPKFFLALFKKYIQRKMEKNPIGWLQQRTWRGRMIVWGWLGILISVYSCIFVQQSFFVPVLAGIHEIIGYGLLISMVLTAAGSFQLERESGLLELLLVSPISTWQIISGRIRGIWGQFLLVFLLWFAMCLFFARSFRESQGNMNEYYFLCGFFTLPVIGLYWSLRCRHFMTSLACTTIMGLILPAYLGGVAQRLLIFYAYAMGWRPKFSTIDPSLYLVLMAPLTINVATVVAQTVIAAWLAVRLHRILDKRTFSTLQRGE
jgi:ABC-type transport system involved in cytochrome c biogenesis permease component